MLDSIKNFVTENKSMLIGVAAGAGLTLAGVGTRAYFKGRSAAKAQADAQAALDAINKANADKAAETKAA
jgi:hypothetical protein